VSHGKNFLCVLLAIKPQVMRLEIFFWRKACPIAAPLGNVDRQGVTDETGDALSPRGIETLKVLGCPGFLCDGLVVRSRKHAWVDCLMIRRERRLLTVHHEQVGLQLLGTVMTATPVFPQ